MQSFKTTLILFAAVAALLPGCSVYRSYERPADIEAAVPADGIPATVCWRDFFDDASLCALIDTALANNLSVLSAREKTIQAKAALRQSKLSFLPSAQLSATYDGTADISAAASWELDFAGRNFNAMRAARASFEQSELLERSVRTELVCTVAEYYYTLLKLDAQLEVSRTTAESWKENVRTTRAMKDAGVSNEASVSQTEANACSIEASLFDLQYQITELENSLAALLGVQPRHFERSKLADEALPRIFENGVPVQMLSRRPDVMAAEAALRTAFYNTAAAHSAFYPSIVLNGGYGWQSALFAAVASLTQPVFRRGELNRNLRVSQSKQREAANEFRQSLISAAAEVNSALSLCESAKGKTDVRIRQIQALERAEYSTTQLMRHGESTYLEVLTAQQSLLSARLLQISDHFDTVSGIVALYRALGGGAD